MRTVIVFIVSALVLSAGCAGPQLEPPIERYPTTKRIQASFDETWEATLGTLFEETALAVVNRGERLIATDWQYGKSDYAYSETAPFGWGSKEYLDSRWRMNVRLKDEGSATRVTIKLIEEVREVKSYGADDYAYAVWIPVESSTRRERKLLEKIDARIRTPERVGRRVKIEAKLKELLDAEDYRKAADYLKHELEFNITDEALKKLFEKRLSEIEAKLKSSQPSE
ncbi:MAG: hypothetical protein E3J72_12730 [Planctomycetota bacterium]|nr:MAG: hypothetical protein E3J72_12730 [Planctomycetota bacterium]